MRIANNNGVNLERKGPTKKPLRKYFLVLEGDKTEPQYFNGIKDNKEELGINSLIDILLLENEEDEQGHSHPLIKLKDFEKTLKKDDIVYFPEIDSVCFVIDRDPKNFFEDQFFKFIKKAGERGYHIFISNPTFELFLLMHDDKIFELDRDEMYKNEFVTTDKRFLEKKVKEFFGCSKNKLNFDKFKNNIDKAIKNEKKFEEHVFNLENKLGSNVGKLIEDMRK